MTKPAKAQAGKGRSQNGRFRKGNKGGPGRPAGTRNKLSEDFVTALCEDFGANGVAAIKSAREESPAAYLRLVASLVPKELDATVSGDNVIVLGWMDDASDDIAEDA